MPRPSRRLPDATLPPRPPWGWAWAGALLGALLVLALHAPAAWLAAALRHASGGQLLLQDAQGSVWSGSAQLALDGGHGSRDRASLPGRLHWRLRPAATGLRLQLHPDCCLPAERPLVLALRPHWGGARLDVGDIAAHQRLTLPAAVLAGLGTPWNTLQPQGLLQLSAQGLSLDWTAGRMRMAGSAELQALDAASRLSTLRPLGSYRLRVDGGDAVRIQLHTLPGSKLLLSGQGQWVGQRLRFDGEARAADGLQAPLANLLNIIGPRQGDKALLRFG